MTRTEVWLATTASRQEWALVMTLPGEVAPLVAARIAASVHRAQAYRMDPHIGMARQPRARRWAWWQRTSTLDVRTVRT